MSKKPKVLFYDIETKPMEAYVWRTGSNMTITHSQLKKGSKIDIICICYKFEGEREIHSLDWGIRKQDSAKMIEEFTKVIESADVVIGHNGDRFDMKHINTQRLLHGQKPIAWPTSEDTLKMFRKHFNFPSNRLDFLSKTLIGAGKDPMQFQDWIDIVEKKDPKAMAKMIKYCKKDVRRLEQVYQLAKPFFQPKAHRGIILGNGRNSCPSCGSRELRKNGTVVRKTGRYQTYQCKNCGSVTKDTRKLPH